MNTNMNTTRPTPETDAVAWVVAFGYQHLNEDVDVVGAEFARQLERERDEARKHLAAANKGAEINAHINHSLAAKLAEAKRERDEARDQLEAMERAGAEQARRADENREWALRAERERDEALAKLSTVYRWIERNHPDGFIDSQSHLQNLDRVADAWHDKLEAMREAISTFAKLQPFLAHE